MAAYVAKIVFCGEGAAITFGSNLTFNELCDNIRIQFPVLIDKALELKFLVVPESTIYRLRNDVDMSMLFMVLRQLNSSWVDINVSTHNEATPANNQPPAPAPTEAEDIFSDLDPNQYLGCFRREDAKSYMTEPWKSYITHKGQSFERGAKDFRVKLRMYAIEVGFEYSYEINKPDRVTAYCKKREAEGCNWRVKASLNRHNGFFNIYELENEHKCKSVVRLSKSKMLSSNIVKAVMADKIRDNLNSKAVDILKDMKLNFGLDIPYHKAWYGKERARDDVLGVEADSYRQLRWFGQNTIQANPGSRIDVQCLPLTESQVNEYRFQRMFVSYASVFSGFEHCRPVLHIDATFITNKYRGMLLAATAKDANCGLYPVAYAIVDSENESNWRYFLENIKACLATGSGRIVTFISDRNLGLLAVVRSVFPNSPLGFCYRHLHTNLLNKYPSGSVHGKRITYLFMVAAYSRDEESFELHLRKLKQEGGQIVEDFLKDLPPKTWASCRFNGERFGEMTNNLAECFNSWVKDLKGLPITDLNNEIRVRIMNLIATRKKLAVGWVSKLCPVMEKRLAANLELGRHWGSSMSNEYLFEIKTGNHTVSVDLLKKLCSCGEWQIHGFPCAHALVAAQSQGSDIYAYVDPLFQVDKYRLTYSFTINPVPTIAKPIQMVSQTVNINPPKTRRPAGRPRQERLKPRSEIKRIIKCSRCHKFKNHNKKTCKEVI